MDGFELACFDPLECLCGFVSNILSALLRVKVVLSGSVPCEKNVASHRNRSVWCIAPGPLISMLHKGYVVRVPMRKKRRFSAHAIATMGPNIEIRGGRGLRCDSPFSDSADVFFFARDGNTLH